MIVTFLLALASLVPSFLEDIAHSQESIYEHLTVPDPSHLHPEWWHYYDASGQELQGRIEKSCRSLDACYDSLPKEAQDAALAYLQSFQNNLQRLQEIKEQKLKPLSLNVHIPKTFTLDEQLNLNHQHRKLKLEIETDSKELKLLKTKITKALQHIDTLMAAYLSATSQNRLLAGLEIMSQRALVGVAEENRRFLKEELEERQAQFDQLGAELQKARSSLDISVFNQTELEKGIALAESELRRKHTEFSNIEIQALSGGQDRFAKHLLSHKVLLASVNEALAWTSLAFHQLRYNLTLHANDRFDLENRQMKEQLKTWKERLNTMSLQHKDWEQLALEGQIQARQDHAILISNNEDSPGHPIHQSHKITSEILSHLQLLDEQINNALWLINQFEHHIWQNSGFLERTLTALDDFVSEKWAHLMTTLNVSLFKIFDVPITLFTLIKIATILGASILLSNLLRYALKTSRSKMSESTRYHVGRLIHYATLFLGMIFALATIGLDFSNIMILLGALTFGIGFGLQTIAINFFCGLRILFERKIKIGDILELQNGHKGKVTEIHVQSTTIYTPDGIEIVIPNSELLNSPLVNWTMNNDFRRLHIPFSTCLKSDKENVRRVVSEAAKKVPCTLHHPQYSDPQVWLTEFAHNALHFELVVWVSYKAPSFTDSKEADFLWAIESALRENNIDLPLQQQVMYVKHLPDDFPHSPLPQIMS